MRITNSKTGYGIVQILIHWAMAILIAYAAYTGLTMTDLPKTELSTYFTYNFHKSLGITVLGLLVLRLGWRLFAGGPGHVEGISDFEQSVATAVRMSIYMLMAGVPILGWLLTSSADVAVNWFNLQVLPQLMGPDKGLTELFVVVHELAAKILLALVILHALAALKHHFIKKNDVLRRMIIPARD